jgi:PAS domain S-box-containing protein
MKPKLSFIKNARPLSPALEASFTRRLNRVVLIPALFMFVLVGILFWQLSYLISVTNWVEHTDQVIVKLWTTRKLMIDMETGERGYLLVGDRRFLEPYEKAVKEVPQYFRQVFDLTKDNPQQQLRLKKALAEFNDWQLYIARMIRLRDDNNPLYKDVSTNLEAKQRLDSLRQQMSILQQHEEALRGERNRTVKTVIPAIILATVGAASMLGGVLTFLARKELLKLSDKYEEILKTTFEQGEELQQSFAQFQTLSDAVPQMVWRTDHHGAVEYMNQRWYDYTGTSAEENIGEGWTEILHPDDQERVGITWAQSVRTGQPYDCEYRMRRGIDGSYRWHIARGIPLRNHEGEITKWFGSNTDIDDQKSTEKVLQERSQELLDLTQRLQFATANLEKRNQELDQFTYIVSHDLKAPLRAVSNLSQWIEEDLNGQLSEEISQQMQLLRSRVHRMNDLINGLLQYSRIGRTEHSYASIDVGSLLSDVSDSIDPPVGFEIEIASEMPVIKKGETVLLRQVFANLISNAINHHHRSKGKITIKAVPKGDFYEFAVQDDGPGIAAAFHDKIFVIFQTLQSRDVFESTGIGLSIVKKIVESQGGTIWVESRVGAGATFRFTWPNNESTQMGNKVCG